MGGIVFYSVLEQVHMEYPQAAPQAYVDELLAECCRVPGDGMVSSRAATPPLLVGLLEGEGYRMSRQRSVILASKASVAKLLQRMLFSAGSQSPGPERRPPGAAAPLSSKMAKAAK